MTYTQRKVWLKNEKVLNGFKNDLEKAKKFLNDYLKYPEQNFDFLKSVFKRIEKLENTIDEVSSIQESINCK